MKRKADTHNRHGKFSISFWQRIRRTPYQSFAAVFMIFITLFVLSIFLLMAATSSAIISYFETKPQITVFFKENQSKATIDGIIENLKSTGKVSAIRYVSKDEALRIYQEQNKNDPLLLEMVTADILPESLEISAVSPKNLSEIAEIVKKEQGIDEVVFQKEVVETLVAWTTTVRSIGILFILFLVISSFLILITNIGMKIAFRKDEIEILKLVGATPWYIRKPFILEGFYYGLIGATLAWLTTSAIVLYLQPFMTSFLRGIPTLPLLNMKEQYINIWPPNISLFVLLWGVLVVIGGIIGFIGSLFAASRYMKY